MEAIKRVEIIVAQFDLPRLKRQLDTLKLNYSVFHHVTGKGDRGPRDDDEVSGVFGNVCVLCACRPAQVTALVEVVRPILKRSGGLCIVSDAQGVIH
ncbi:MAG: hypothetical protein Q8M02_05380 [Candidatus Didemnitutus sp.]|nr:hypothetical protein [Candidatus Didemnitutus sp.]